MAYIDVSNKYNDVIYSGDAKTRVILKINDITVCDLDTLPEDNKISQIVKTHNIIKVGENRLSLDNFVAQDLEIKIYDFDYSLYEDSNLGANEYNEIELALATLTDTIVLSTTTEETWEEVPLGIFNIVETPKTDKDITTIKAKCNRIKFDIPYNAKSIIDENDGEVEIGTLLEDICLFAGVELGTSLPFINSTTTMGVYDNTITATIYVTYICEKAGSIATIGRDGKLYLIPINNDLYEHTIDDYLIKGEGSLEYGEKFIYDRVCYEFGLDKYATPMEDFEKTTIYINGSNPYITKQEEIDDIYDSINGFEIQNLKFTTIGNPCIDAWDLVSFEKGGTEYKTLANNTLIFSGVLTQSFDTSIGTKETTKENVTVLGEKTFRKTIGTTVDNINASLKITADKTDENELYISSIQLTPEAIRQSVSKVDELDDDINNPTTGLSKKYSDLESDIDGVKQSMTYSGGYNLIENCVKQFGEAGWDGTFENYSNTEIQQNSLTKSALVFMNDTETREIQVENRTHNFSFKYKKLVPLATATITINGIEIELTEDEWTEVEQNINVTNNLVTITLSSDADNSVWLVDALLIPGNIQQIWTPNPNEINTGVIKLGGDTLTIESNTTTTKFVASTDGTRVYNTNDLKDNPLADPIAEFTSEGVWTKTITGTKGEISKVLIVDMGAQTWFSRM